MESWKFFFTTPENDHMSLDASVTLCRSALLMPPPLQHAVPFPAKHTPSRHVQLGEWLIFNDSNKPFHAHIPL